MELIIKIKLDNAAFGESEEEQAQEVARILREYQGVIRQQGRMDRTLRDVNGNTVGSAKTR